MSWKVLITARSFGMGDPWAKEALSRMGCLVEVVSRDVRFTEQSLMNALGDVDAIIVGSDPLSGKVIGAAPHLKVVSKHGTGVDNIDIAACSARGIVVTNVPGVNNESVADLTMGFIICLARSIIQADVSVRSGGWKRFIGIELSGKVLGLIGFGAIGRAVARRALAFGMKVKCYDPLLKNDDAHGVGVTPTTLEDVLQTADFVSLHVPLNDTTRGMLDGKRLCLMKPSAFLINTSRGEVLDEHALYEQLATGRLAGAALDVFTHEPPSGSPLLKLSNVICTPHYAAYTNEALSRMDKISVENVCAAIRGGKPEYVVNPEVYGGRD